LQPLSEVEKTGFGTPFLVPCVKDVKDVKVVLWSPRKKNKNIKACNLLFFYKKFVFLLSHLSHRHRNTLELR
jgi:hypothetical protein